MADGQVLKCHVGLGNQGQWCTSLDEVCQVTKHNDTGEVTSQRCVRKQYCVGDNGDSSMNDFVESRGELMACCESDMCNKIDEIGNLTNSTATPPTTTDNSTTTKEKVNWFFLGLIPGLLLAGAAIMYVLNRKWKDQEQKTRVNQLNATKSSMEPTHHAQLDYDVSQVSKMTNTECEISQSVMQLNTRVKTPEDIFENPKKSPKNPKNLPKNPKDLPKTPQASPGKTKDSPGKPKDFTENPKDWPEKPKDLPGKPKDLPEKPKDLPEILKDLPEKPKDLPEKPKDLLEKPEDLPEKPKYLPKTPKDLTEKTQIF